MSGQMVEIQSQEGKAFQAYLALPNGTGAGAAVVIASSVHGIDRDHQSIADEFASHGIIALAPDLFWRSIPGPLPRGDTRTPGRAQPREEKIRIGESDMTDALSYLRSLDCFDGRAIAVGFCYGGPFAILGPKRLGYAAGISCHGSKMGSYLEELEGVEAPVAIIWGDEDHAAPPEILRSFEAASQRMPNFEHVILPGIRHGYMLRGNTRSFDQAAYDWTMQKAVKFVEALPRRPN